MTTSTIQDLRRELRIAEQNRDDACRRGDWKAAAKSSTTALFLRTSINERIKELKG